METNATKSIDSRESWECKMESKLKEGKTLMNEGVYSNALGPIMKALNMCACNPASHGKDKSCNISQCILAIQDTDPDALSRVATGPCSCGFVWPSCTRPLHLQAVDTLAECLEKTGHYAPAFSTALGLIRLDPASAIGYCRVIRIIRYLVKHHQGSDKHDARSLSALLRDAKLPSVKPLGNMVGLFAKCGLHNTEKYRHSPNDKYHAILRQIAHKLNLPEARKDPLTKLPREIVGMIFSYVDTTTLIRCCRVSKLWRQVIEPDKAMWSSIRLKRPRSSRYFTKFLQRHRDVRSLVLEDVSRLGLSAAHLRAIVLLQKLQHLYIGNPNVPSFQPDHNLGDLFKLRDPGEKRTAILKRLSLVLDGSDGFDTWENLMNCMSTDLEVLDLVPGPRPNLLAGDPTTAPFLSFPKLKKLRLDWLRWAKPLMSRYAVPKLSMAELARNTPNLEHLYLDGLEIEFGNDDGFETHPDKLRYWQSLRSLTIGSGCALPLRTVFAPPFLPSTLKVLELFSNRSSVAETILRGINPSSEHGGLLDPALGYSAEEFQPHHLEVFRCRSQVSAHLLRRVIEPAVQSGSLKVLELGGGDLNDPIATPADEYLYAASDHVHTLGMYNFNWSESGTSFNGQPFLDWLKLFPNVKTVTVYPWRLPDVARFIMKLICHPGIEVVHQDQLRGVEWDEAKGLAKKHGVKLCHTPSHTPIGWPLLD